MLILLDLDGVMVTAKSWSSPMILEDGFSVFKPKAIKALNMIISKTDAQIILTTSHKHKYSLSQWVEIFKFRCINIDKIDRLPENTENLNRLEEITKWFSTIETDRFVIIDDDKILNNLPFHLKSRLIQTKPMIGLTAERVPDVLEILQRPLEFV